MYNFNPNNCEKFGGKINNTHDIVKCEFSEENLNKIAGISMVGTSIGPGMYFGIAKYNRKLKSNEFGPSYMFIPIDDKTWNKWMFKYGEKNSINGSVTLNPPIGHGKSVIQWSIRKDLYKKFNGTIKKDIEFPPIPWEL